MSSSRTNMKWSDLSKILLVVVAVNVGVYGCSRPVPHKNAGADRTRALESRCSKLETDFRTMTQARDRARAELAKLEDETARLQKELTDRVTVRERDELVAQLKEAQAQREELRKALVNRTGERDKLKERAEKLRKGLQTMLSADDGPESGTTPTAAPAATSAAPAGPAPAPQT